MIRTIYRKGDGSVQIDLSPERLDTALQDSAGLLWPDFENESPDSCRPILSDLFRFHPLAAAGRVWPAALRDERELQKTAAHLR